jgi:hypothetical protein
MPETRPLSNAERLTLKKIEDVIILLRQEKPGDRTEVDRHYAICITETEKLLALYRGLILTGEFINE